MSDILAPIWDSPPTSSEDWKKDEKDLTLSLGVQGYLKPSTVSCSLLGNTSLEWWRLLLVFSQHEEGTSPHPTVLLALKPFFMGYSIQAASWGQQQLTPQDGQQTTRCFLSEGQRVPCRALCYGGPAAAPSLCGPLRRSEEHLAWNLPGPIWASLASSSFPWFFFLIYNESHESLLQVCYKH